MPLSGMLAVVSCREVLIVILHTMYGLDICEGTWYTGCEGTWYTSCEGTWYTVVAVEWCLLRRGGFLLSKRLPASLREIKMKPGQKRAAEPAAMGVACFCG